MGSYFAKYKNKVFVIQIVFFLFLNISLIKEMFLLKLISLNAKRVLEILLIFYFMILALYLKNFGFSLIFLLFPLILLLFLFVFLKKQEDRDLLFQLYSLLAPLESQMKQGAGFINAWQKSLKELKSKKIKTKAQKITEILKFQKDFHCPDREVENFIKDLIIVHQSDSPLKRLKYLQRKIRIEMAFQTKSRRLLMQIRIQSCILSFFYFGLLIWTIGAYGARYIHLTVVSFLLFFTGLLWIFKTGRKMKWSV